MANIRKYSEPIGLRIVIEKSLRDRITAARHKEKPPTPTETAWIQGAIEAKLKLAERGRK